MLAQDIKTSAKVCFFLCFEKHRDLVLDRVDIAVCQMRYWHFLLILLLLYLCKRCQPKFRGRLRRIIPLLTRLNRLTRRQLLPLPWQPCRLQF